MTARIELTWNEIDHITAGRIGRTMAICPLCSASRRTPQKRNSKVLAVTLLEPEFAVYYCNHCETQGYCRPDSPSRIVDWAQQQRLRDRVRHHAREEKQERTRQALAIWNEAQAQPCRGSPIEDYLYYTRGVGDWLDTLPFLDRVFCYHPSCPFGGERLPCMLAPIRDIKTNAPVAIHRTSLTTDNPPRRLDRRSLGPTSGGAIKISPNADVHAGLLIGEGIETVLSASKLLQFKPVWSVIDKNGVANFPVLPGIESITIAVDNDDAGQQAAQQCVGRLTQAGVEVFTVRPNLAG
jgi:hypothetical protein